MGVGIHVTLDVLYALLEALHVHAQSEGCASGLQVAPLCRTRISAGQYLTNLTERFRSVMLAGYHAAAECQDPAVKV